MYKVFVNTLITASRLSQRVFTTRSKFLTSGTLLAGSFLWSSASEKKTDASILSVIKDADIFYNQYMIDNAYNILRKYRKSDDPELLWRLARVICEQGKGTKNPEEKMRLFKEALEFAEKAISNEEARGSFGAHKWYAIILNYVSELEGTKAQIKAALDVKRHFERALEINPMDATTWMTLGIWHYSFADLGTASRLAAKVIYGTPPSSSYEEALRHFERAETIQPEFCSTNNFYLGTLYEKLGKKEQAIDHYTKAFKAPIVSVDDHQYHEKSFKKLQQFGVTLDLSNFQSAN